MSAGFWFWFATIIFLTVLECAVYASYIYLTNTIESSL